MFSMNNKKGNNMSKTGTSAIDALNQEQSGAQRDGNFNDAYSGHLMCEVMHKKSVEAVVTFMEMCGDQTRHYPLALEIGENQLKIIHHAKLFMAHLNLSKEVVEVELDSLREFLLQGQRVAMPTQNLVCSLQKEDVR